MSSYTANHLYGNRQFQEANRARREPYTDAAYKCKHSQRAFLPSYDNYSQRVHDDPAGVGGCCDEPVRLFEYKPQFMEIGNPIKSQNCSQRVGEVECTDVQFTGQPWTTQCASSGKQRMEGLRIACYNICYDDLAQLPAEEVFPGQYGRWIFQGLESRYDLVADYEAYDGDFQGVVDTCSGPVGVSEYFCGSQVLSYTIEGSLGTPNCRCDCCGNNGQFPAPIGAISAPAAVTANHLNTIDIGLVVNSQACYDANLYSNFSANPQGPTGPHQIGTYYGQGAAVRQVYSDPTYIGDADHPACCGGSVEFTGDNGCATGSNPPPVNMQVNRGFVGDPDFDISGGTVFSDGKLRVGDTYTIGVDPSCPDSNQAEIDYSTSDCLGTPGGSYNNSGYLMRRTTHPLVLEDGVCSKCCGGGVLNMTYNAGCGQTDASSWDVRREWGFYNIGWEVRCNQVSPGTWRPQKRTANCQNTQQGSWGDEAVAFGTVGECIAYVRTDSTYRVGRCNNPPSGVTKCVSCCFYSDNGAGDESFRAQFSCLDGEQCCNLWERNRAYIIGDDLVGGCCPIIGT